MLENLKQGALTELLKHTKISTNSSHIFFFLDLVDKRRGITSHLKMPILFLDLVDKRRGITPHLKMPILF